MINWLKNIIYKGIFTMINKIKLIFTFSVVLLLFSCTKGGTQLTEPDPIIPNYSVLFRSKVATKTLNEGATDKYTFSFDAMFLTEKAGGSRKYKFENAPNSISATYKNGSSEIEVKVNGSSVSVINNNVTENMTLIGDETLDNNFLTDLSLKNKSGTVDFGVMRGQKCSFSANGKTISFIITVGTTKHNADYTFIAATGAKQGIYSTTDEIAGDMLGYFAGLDDTTSTAKFYSGRLSGTGAEVTDDENIWDNRVYEITVK